MNRHLYGERLGWGIGLAGQQLSKRLKQRLNRPPDHSVVGPLSLSPVVRYKNQIFSAVDRHGTSRGVV